MTKTKYKSWSSTEMNYKTDQDLRLQKIEDQISIFKEQIAFLIRIADESVPERKK